MSAFLHDRIRRLEAVLASAVDALRTYQVSALDVAAPLVDLLDRAAAAYAALGPPEREHEVRALAAEFAAARHGIDPRTSERVTGRRRDLERAVALRALLECGRLLRTDLDDARRRLEDARRQLLPIVLVAQQKGLDLPADGAPVDAWWGALAQDADLALAARQVAMAASRPDIELLVGDLAASSAWLAPAPTPAP